MPLFYQHNINDSTKLAVWHITEDEDFFFEKASVTREVMHPHKRLQHLAGRYLLQLLHPGFPFHLIEIAESKKPLLSNGKLHFSISHCKDFAAAIVSENKPDSYFCLPIIFSFSKFPQLKLFKPRLNKDLQRI